MSQIDGKQIKAGTLPGGGGVLGSGWRFDSAIADADPGSGDFRFNNAVQSSATEIFISNIASNGLNASAILLLLSSGNKIYIQEESDVSRFHEVDVTGDPTNAGAYVKIPITVLSSGVDLRNNRGCHIIIFFAGGGSGGGAGDKAINISEPGPAETDTPGFFTKAGFTVGQLDAVLVGASDTPSVTWTLKYAPNRDDAGTEVVTGGTATTSTAGQTITSFNNATIPADSWVWLETTAQTGIVGVLSVTVTP